MKSSGNTPADQRRFFISLAFFLFTVGVIGFAAISRAPRGTVTPTPAQSLPMNPTVVANVQNAANLALPESQRIAVQDIKTRVDACPDYGPERRGQMLQHIAWLLDPTTIPSDILMAIGEDPMGRLVLGMSTFTRVQWQLLNSPAGSCLLEVDAQVNALLAAAGQPTAEPLG
jgi:hypothetical protein